MDNYLDIIIALTSETLFIILVMAATCGLFISLWLLVNPQNFANIEDRLNRTYSTRRSLRPLEISRNIDRHIYRHHKLFGLLTIFASTYTIYELLFDILPNVETENVGQPTISVTLQVSIQTFSLFLLLGNIATLLVGLVVYTRPSTLKDFESKANRWISMRPYLRWMDTKIASPDRLIRTQPRLLAITLFTLSIYLLSILTMS